MSSAARLESTDVLKALRIAMFKFSEQANVALADAEAEMHRTQVWLDTEQQSFWQGQIRKRGELVSRCKEAVRMKKVFKDSTGRIPSAVDEEKALAVAQKKLDEANQKYAATKSWARKIQKEIMLYKGDAQRLATAVQMEIPNAVSILEGIVAKIEGYASLAVSQADAFIEGSDASMARSADEMLPAEEKKPDETTPAAEPQPEVPQANKEP